MIRQTSLQAYKDIQPELSKIHKIIMELLKMNKKYSMTDQEMAYALDKSDPNWVRPRRRELVIKGLVEEKGKRKCTVTNKTSITWGLRGCGG